MFLLVLLFGLALAGCATKEGEHSQGVFKDKIYVGNSAGTSGTLAAIGVPYVAGMQAYFNMINSKGGVDGRKIEFIHMDDECDPTKGKAALIELVEDKKVFAIVGHFSTPIVSATLADLKAYGIPAVYFATGMKSLYMDKASADHKALFPVQPTYRAEGKLLISRVVGQYNAKKIGVIYTSDDAGNSYIEGIEEQAREIGGLELVKQQIPPAAVDVAATVTALKNANVDVIIVAAMQNTFPNVAKELATQGNTKPVFTGYLNAQVVITQQIKDYINDKFEIFATNWVILTDPQLNADYETWIPKEYIKNSNGNAGWIAAHFFVEGLKRLKGKNVTWENYIAAMEQAPIKNPFGGYIDFSDGKRLGTTEFNLEKFAPNDPNTPSGWVVVDQMRSIDDLLNKNKK